MYGTAAHATSPSVVPLGPTPIITKSCRPNGGLSAPMTMQIIISVPNQIGSIATVLMIGT